MLLLALVSALAFEGAPARAATGDIYAKSDTARKTPLFRIERTAETAGAEQTITVRYLDPAGAEAARETAFLRGGGLVRSELVQNQLGERGSARVDGGRVTIGYGKSGTPLEESTEKAPAKPLVTPATLPAFVTASWARLLRGESIDVRLVAYARKETVGFTIARAGGAAPGAVAIRVTATSPFIRLLVDPLVLTFDASGQKLRAYEGRTALKRRDGAAWRDFDGATLYRDE